MFVVLKRKRSKGSKTPGHMEICSGIREIMENFTTMLPLDSAHRKELLNEHSVYNEGEWMRLRNQNRIRWAEKFNRKLQPGE